MQKHLDNAPQAMSVRRQTAEHACGKLKAWIGDDAFPDQDLETRLPCAIFVAGALSQCELADPPTRRADSNLNVFTRPRPDPIRSDPISLP